VRSIGPISALRNCGGWGRIEWDVEPRVTGPGFAYRKAQLIFQTDAKVA
jgi:hypothetical protein